MTRKDYDAIAAAIEGEWRETRKADIDGFDNGSLREGIARCACSIAATMARDNPRFDRARFLKACGVQS